MSFLGRLFGSDKATEALVNNVSNGIDKLFYTSEEKAEDAAQARREGQAVLMKWLESTSGSRLARRVLALIVTGIWALEHVGALMTAQVAVFSGNPEKWLKSSQLLAQYANDNNTLVAVVLMFYFGGPVAMDGIKGMLNKWADKPARSQLPAPKEQG